MKAVLTEGPKLVTVIGSRVVSPAAPPAGAAAGGGPAVGTLLPVESAGVADPLGDPQPARSTARASQASCRRHIDGFMNRHSSSAAGGSIGAVRPSPSRKTCACYIPSPAASTDSPGVDRIIDYRPRGGHSAILT